MEHVVDLMSQLGVLSFFCALVILAVFWAANHKWVVYDKDTHIPYAKGLILVGIKEKAAKFFTKLDSLLACHIVKNAAILIFVAGVSGLLFMEWESISPYQRLSLGLTSVLLLFYGKSFEDIGVFFLGCYRCMPTFWIGMPMFLYGLISYLRWGNPAYLEFIPAAIITVCITSFFTTVLGSFQKYIEKELTKE